MYVLVKSSISGNFYQSPVYAEIRVSGECSKLVVYNRFTGDFELADMIDVNAELPKELIHIIIPDRDGFVYSEGDGLNELKNYAETNGKMLFDVVSVHGIPEVCQSYGFLCDLFEYKKVPAGKYNIPMLKLPDAGEWKYIKTQSEADAFMKLFAGFHDATVKSVEYGLLPQGAKRLTAVFDSEWYGTIEMCFEGLQLLKLDFENYGQDWIYCAELNVNEKGVKWSACNPENDEEDYILKAISVKWRDKEESKKKDK